MKRLVYTVVALMLSASGAQAQYYGNYSSNPYAPNRTNPYQYGGGQYGTDSTSPGLYTDEGQFRGNMNSNQYDPNSVANPYGRYGSQYSPDSINNPYGAGSPYRPDSPSNPYGSGLRICGISGCD
ncbi:hypothetical protein VSX64_23475 [Aurantimonas sp. C2-6-R+9]|uniref:hypothetical protein n=1 Tax=unclassified Aurantimonas TaxID=2638230 RepID=UPI002E1896AB|nr:hypothetical protein [Aurantimonas sp. C2-6-R+9]